MEHWADSSRAGCCWLWTDVETWTSSPRPWTSCSLKQRCVILCHSDTQWSPPKGFTKQQQVTSSNQVWWELEIRGSWSPGEGYNSITKHTSRQAAVFYTGWQMCMHFNLCTSSPYHVSHVLYLAHTASASWTQFLLSPVTNSLFMLCHMRWEDGWKTALRKIPMFTTFELSLHWTVAASHIVNTTAVERES